MSSVEIWVYTDTLLKQLLQSHSNLFIVLKKFMKRIGVFFVTH